MAGLRCAAATSAIATGTSAKTLLQIVAASNHRAVLYELTISFAGTSNTATPIKVDVLRQTDAGTMSSLSLGKLDSTDDETLQTTAQHTATSEPTASTVLRSWYVHPQSGTTWMAPFKEPFIIPGGGRLGVRVTAAADVNALVTAYIEE